MNRPTYDDTRHGPKAVHASVPNALAVGWRREHAVRIWQCFGALASVVNASVWVGNRDDLALPGWRPDVDHTGPYDRV
jgi:hypothetical protein